MRSAGSILWKFKTNRTACPQEQSEPISIATRRRNGHAKYDVVPMVIIAMVVLRARITSGYGLIQTDFDYENGARTCNNASSLGVPLEKHPTDSLAIRNHF
jgi:hypothetical protein